MAKPLRFPYPSTNEEAAKLFWSLCKDVPQEEIPSVLAAVKEALKHIEGFEGSLLGPDLNAAREICSRLELLLSRYAEHPGEERSLIIGAALYFVTTKDFKHDYEPLVGLDDDARILNHVLEKLNLTTLFVNVD